MQGVRQALKGQGFSVRATTIIISSWHEATQAQYTTYIKRWQVFCNEWQVNPTNQSLSNNILDFHSNLFDSGLSYSTLNTARSALSATIMIQGYMAGSHPMIIRYMKGVYNLRLSLA